MTSMGNTPLAGRYVLIDQIGAGGMGSVWRAWDLKSQTFVAAKLLGQHDSGMLLRFVREQSVRIRHPHVVAPSGWAAEDNLVIFTMDLVKGGSIHTLLGDHGRLPESYTAVVLDQTLQALEAVHAAGVVHRDVKPANLLLEPTGTRRPHVRLGDFGVAALIDEVRLTRFPGAIGTDGYMAPEQAHGAAPEPQQDLYALGVVGIQMLTGLSPRHQKGAPDGPYREFLEALTQEDSEKRPATASEALQLLRSAGVPPGTPWQSDSEPPEVFNQLVDVAPPPPSYYPSYTTGNAMGASFATPTPFPQQSSPFGPPGPQSGAHSGARPDSSGAHGGAHSGAHSGGPRSRPNSYAGPAHPGPAHSGPAHPGPAHSGAGSSAPASSGHGSAGRAAFVGPAATGGTYPATMASSSSSSSTSPALIVAIICFVAAIAMAGSALWLMLA
ncbi:protein kinase [Nocardioides sp. JQ2195]|uniref:serine/threonine-protein kinase n=1 Tax=Nocardioides sp. JQ2195 TaxID=2592334 RepID=UPI00143E5900|nr:serine/threonine-protein kinase [Nocardioides sp. JQ2195]QIX28483.1 protein kinase [Nocardioides sp. JQ2195]